MSKQLQAFTFTRAGEIEFSGSTWQSLCATFAGTFTGCATLLALKVAGRLQTFLLSSDPRADVAAEHLAKAISATAHKVEVPIELFEGTKSLGMLRAKRDQPSLRASVVDLDVSTVASSLAAALPESCFIAVSFREPRSRELRRQWDWVLDRTDASSTTHISTQVGAQVVRIFVGGPTRSEVKATLRSAPKLFGGFDYLTSPQVPSVFPAVAALAVAALGFGAFLYRQGTHLALIILAALAIFGLGFYLAYTFSSRALTPKRVLARLTSKPKAAPLWGSRKPKPDPEGRPVRKMSYPLHPTSFMLAPHQFVPLVAPGGGATSGETVTRDRPMPQVFGTDIGPVIGTSTSSGEDVHLSAADAFSGLLVVGEAGSGKTVLLRNLFAWSLLDATKPKGFPGFPGAANTILAFENKDETSVAEYVAWGASLGKQVFVCDLLDPSTLAVDLTPRTLGSVALSAKERASFFVEAMGYAFPEGAIGHRSRSTLTSLICAGLVVEADPTLAALASLEGGHSFLYYAHVLCGRLDDEVASTLAKVIMAQAVRTPDPSTDLLLASDALLPIFGEGVTKSQRVSLQDAPKSKLDELLKAEAWFTPGRPRATWEQMLTSCDAFVFNLGKSATGELVVGELAQIMSSMLAFTLRQSVATTCAGWQDQGRSVSIFSDELSLLSGSNPDVFRWLRDQGRSYGVRLFFGTQYLEQLDPGLQNTILGFGTLISLGQGNPEIAERLAKVFASDGQPWSASDIINLPQYVAVVRASVGQSRQSAFNASLGFWEDQRHAFPVVQGYSSGTQVLFGERL